MSQQSTGRVIVYSRKYFLGLVNKCQLFGDPFFSYILLKFFFFFSFNIVYHSDKGLCCIWKILTGIISLYIFFSPDIIFHFEGGRSVLLDHNFKHILIQTVSQITTQRSSSEHCSLSSCYVL